MKLTQFASKEEKDAEIGLNLENHYQGRGYVDLGNMRPFSLNEAKIAKTKTLNLFNKIKVETLNLVDGSDTLNNKIDQSLENITAQILGIDPKRIYSQSTMDAGTSANDKALRTWRMTTGKNKFVVSEQAHSEIIHSAKELWMGFIVCPSGDDYRINQEALKKIIAKEQDNLALIILQGGTTQTGVVDIIDEEIKNSGIPMHIDAAWGGANISLLPENNPEKENLQKLLQHADSVTMDPHKFLGSIGLATLSFLSPHKKSDKSGYFDFIKSGVKTKVCKWRNQRINLSGKKIENWAAILAQSLI